MSVYNPPYVAERDPTAVLGRRVVAYLIDLVIPAALFFVLFAATATMVDKEGVLQGVDVCDVLRNTNHASLCFESGDSAFTLKGGEAVLVALVPLLVALANWVFLQSATGASLGKLVTRLRVVDGQGRQAGIGRNLLRWVLLVVDSICAVLGLIVAASTNPHRRVGDFVAGTYVVDRASVGSPIAVPPSHAPPPAQSSPFSAPTAGYPPTWPPTPQQPHEPQPATTTQASPSAPVWDAQRNAWVSFDPSRNAWLRYDDATKEWRALD